jgi:hypothetical protein
MYLPKQPPSRIGAHYQGGWSVTKTKHWFPFPFLLFRESLKRSAKRPGVVVVGGTGGRRVEVPRKDIIDAYRGVTKTPYQVIHYTSISTNEMTFFTISLVHIVAARDAVFTKEDRPTRLKSA